MKMIYIMFLVALSLFGSSCADQYSNESYATASDNFGDIAGNSFEKYFNKDIDNFKEFKKTDIQGEIYFIKKDSFIKKGDNYYPLKNGVWKLHVDRHNQIDEINLAHDILYQDSVEQIANDLNDDMDNLWAKWAGNAYGYYMVPEYVQINYNSFYISLKAFIYGSEGDSTGLKKAYVDFYIINNTKEVNKYMRCEKGILQ